MILIGCDIRVKEDLALNEILENEVVSELNDRRDNVHEIAKENIQQIQEENRKSFNKKRKKEIKYNVNDLVVIRRKLFGRGNGMKLRPKCLGSYKVLKKYKNGRYEVEWEILKDLR